MANPKSAINLMPEALKDHREWLLKQAAAQNSNLIWNTKFQTFLEDMFSSDARLDFWDDAALPKVIFDFMAARPDKPRLEQGRYAVFCAAPMLGAGNRGLLWVDCGRPELQAAFAALVQRRRRFYNLEIYLTERSPELLLPPQLLSSIHCWLRTHHAGNIVSIDVHSYGVFAYSLDPSHCGLEDAREKRLKFQPRAGVA